MAKIIIEDKTRIEWDRVPYDVQKAIETLLYTIEENTDSPMISHVEEI